MAQQVVDGDAGAGNHGSSDRTSASRSSRLRSHSRSRQMAVNDFEIEPIWKSVRASKGRTWAGIRMAVRARPHQAVAAAQGNGRPGCRPRRDQPRGEGVDPSGA